MTTETKNMDTLLTDDRLLDECRKYIALHDELMERTKGLTPTIKKRGLFLVEHNGRHLKMTTGLYSSGPLEISEYAVLED